MIVDNELLQKLRNRFMYNGEQINYSKASRFLYGKYIHHNETLKFIVNILREEEKSYLLNYKYQYSDDVWRVYTLSLKNELNCTIYNFTKLKHKLYIKDLKNFIHKNKSYTDFTNIITMLNALDDYIPLKELDLIDIRSLHSNLLLSLRETSIRKIFASCNKFFNFMYPNNKSPFNLLSFKNSENISLGTKIIPKHVLNFLDNSEQQIGTSYYLMYCLLKDTGLRFKEAINIHSSDFLDERDNYIKLRYRPFKIEKYFDNQYAYTYIHKDLFKRLPKGGYLFNFSLDAFTAKINKVLSENNIKWKFSSRQLRKTLATNLIENGATVHQVATQLNHLKYATTEKYYIELNKRNLAENNSKFFIEGLEIKECIAEDLNNCAFCSKLCTSTKYLDEWIKLYNEQLLKNSKSKLLNQYKVIIDKLKEIQ